jgi:hypothetical protein
MAKSRYKNNIWIDGDAAYNVGVTAQLDEIAKHRTGRAILNAIQKKTLEVVIVPWPDKDEPGASTRATDIRADGPPGQTRLTCQRGGAGQPFLDDQGKPVVFKDVKDGGGGSGSTIFYSPEESKRIRGAGNDPDEVLFHELCHSLRNLTGLARCEAVGERFDDIEEFWAILITNIYRSECGRSGLRGDHSVDKCPGSKPGNVTICLKQMDAKLTDSAAFYQHYKIEMEKIFTPMRALGAEIAIYVDADFNPLYEYGRAHWGLGVKVRATK